TAAAATTATRRKPKSRDETRRVAKANHQRDVEVAAQRDGGEAVGKIFEGRAGRPRFAGERAVAGRGTRRAVERLAHEGVRAGGAETHERRARSTQHGD